MAGAALVGAELEPVLAPLDALVGAELEPELVGLLVGLPVEELDEELVGLPVEELVGLPVEELVGVELLLPPQIGTTMSVMQSLGLA